MIPSNELKLKFFKSPKASMGKGQYDGLLEDMREVAKECFQEVPKYQIFSDDENPDVDNVVVVAYDGVEVVGFTSSLLFNMQDRKVLHLGLTCVKPSYQGKKVSQKLYTKLISTYCFFYSPFKRIWISNLACVLSSLGNVAKNFNEVYPSPRYQVCPSLDHYHIASEINEKFREQMYIPESAGFDQDKNVFINSVTDTVFEKAETDTRYYHRTKLYNKFYKKIINFDRGDEVLQIGYVDSWTILSKAINMTYAKFNKKRLSITLEEPEVKRG